jgi:hypothetical protein
LRHQQTSRSIAEFQADQAILIPSANDLVYAPSAGEAGAYARFRVVGREFYFD